MSESSARMALTPNPHERPGELVPKNGGMVERIPDNEEGQQDGDEKRRFTAEFKAKVVMEALRGDRTIQAIASNDAPLGIGDGCCRRTFLPRTSTPPLSWPSPGRAKHGSNR